MVARTLAGMPSKGEGEMGLPMHLISQTLYASIFGEYDDVAAAADDVVVTAVPLSDDDDSVGDDAGP